MAGSVAKAYVQVIPSAEGIKGKLSNVFNSEMPSAGQSAGGVFGSNLVGKIKGLIAGAGIGKILSDSLQAGAALQQSLGGIETLFKDSASTVIANAEKAYKTAGMSANEYMETVTGFSASLLQSLGGDTAAAATAADVALQDMADNANKMGTSMESIQYAYQGFAKQNYTMLDNLKLGYGGTKTEMQRLLADAQKLTGIEYNIDNLSDVYSAIHVIQEEMGITGATANEAATTFSGSLASMKASFSDLLANLSTGRDIGPSLTALGETIFTFVQNNLLPMVGNIFAALPDAALQSVDEIGNVFAERIPGLSVIFKNLEAVIISLTAAFAAYKAATAISGIIDALRKATEGQTLAQTLLNAVMNANPFVLIATLVAGLVAAIITLWNTNEGFRNALISAWEAIKSAANTIFTSVANFFTETIPNAFNSVLDWFKNVGKWFEDIGKNIVDGLKKGIQNAWKNLVTWFKGLFGDLIGIAKKILGIASPSKVMRDQVGKWIPSGVAVGIEANTKPLTEALHDMSALTTDSLQSDMNLTNTLSGMAVSPVAVGISSEAQIHSNVLDRICCILEDIEESNSVMLETSISVLKEILEAVLGIHLTDDDIYNAVDRVRTRRVIMTGGGTW